VGTTTVNVTGVAAIQLPAVDGHAGCIDVLVRAGADVNHANSDGVTAIMVAALNDKRDASAR